MPATIPDTHPEQHDQPDQADRMDDCHYLRSGAESETDRIAEKDESAPVPGMAAGPLWPLPADAEMMLTRMRQWDRWAVLAVRIDGPVDAKLPKILLSGLEQLLTRTISGDYEGIYFDWQPHLYGLVLPHSTAQKAMTAARTIQQELAGQHVHTVSIGITEFPLHDFDPRQTLVNACKALDHGAFFGPGTCTVFDAVSLNVSGDRFYQAGDLDCAITEYRHALTLDSANINVRNSLGVCLAQKGDIAAARMEFETVCRMENADAMALFNIGLIDLQQGQPEQAVGHFEKAYAADSHTYDIPFQLGKLLCDQGRTEQALKYLQAALKIRNKHAPLHALMGQCLHRTGKINEAIAAYKTAIKLNPYDAASLSELGVLYAERGENREICLTFCRQSVLIAPRNGLYRYRLGRLYHDSGQWEQALEQYELAVELGQDAAGPLAEIRNRLPAGPAGSMRCA